MEDFESEKQVFEDFDEMKGLKDSEINIQFKLLNYDRFKNSNDLSLIH